MGARKDFADFVREDDRRKRDDAKIQTLQTQVDEIRHVTRELLSRQLRLEEQLKASEVGLAQQRMALEQHRQEVAQANQARQVEDGRLRQQMSDLGERIEDAGRPIRSLQAHVAELIETVRRQREDVGQDSRRFDELRVVIDHLAAHTERQLAVSQTLRDSIDAVRVELERQQRDLIRADDGVRILEQEVRRRIAEVVQQGENYAAQIADGREALAALQLQVEDVRQGVQGIVPELDAFRQVQERFEGEIARFHSQALERDAIGAERLEDVRQQLDQQLRDIQAVEDQRYERLTQRADKLDETDRELAYRISMLEIQLEERQQVDAQLRREMWYLHEQRARLRVEQAQRDLEAIAAARREAEQQDGADRSTDRRLE